MSKYLILSHGARVAPPSHLLLALRELVRVRIMTFSVTAVHLFRLKNVYLYV